MAASAAIEARSRNGKRRLSAAELARSRRMVAEGYGRWAFNAAWIRIDRAVLEVTAARLETLRETPA